MLFKIVVLKSYLVLSQDLASFMELSELLDFGALSSIVHIGDKVRYLLFLDGNSLNTKDFEAQLRKNDLLV